MNSCYEENLDKNFKRAISLCEGRFAHSELLEFLQNGSMPEKQFAALEIDSIQSEYEAEILMSNLTGVDGKIREAVSFKISELIKDTPQYFLKFPEIFADATIDINANICRTIIECLCFLQFDENFVATYINRLKKFINIALQELDSFNFKDKKYTINKQLFKIYWCLEGINVFFPYIDEDSVSSLLTKCALIEEYTIREKVALVLKNTLKSAELLALRKQLQLDENYYVKNV